MENSLAQALGQVCGGRGEGGGEASAGWVGGWVGGRVGASSRHPLPLTACMPAGTHVYGLRSVEHGAAGSATAAAAVPGTAAAVTYGRGVQPRGCGGALHTLAGLGS